MQADEKRPQGPWPPAGWPRLRPEDRLSTHADYYTIVPNYAELVAAEGEARARESMDYLFYFLNTSYELLAEREFEGWRWPLDPHDYLVYELYAYLEAAETGESQGLGPDLADPLARHLIADGIGRYDTPAVRRDLARRARRLARRRAGTVTATQAQAVAMVMEEGSVAPMTVGLLVESFRQAALAAVLDLPDLLDREWEERDRNLDRWLVALRRADAEHPAAEAEARLQEAGPRAMPQVAHVFYDPTYGCDDEPLRAALRVAATAGVPQSLWMLRQAIVDCPGLAHWAAEALVAYQPERASAYFRCLLTGPQPLHPRLAGQGLWVLAAARAPEAFELARRCLDYRADDAAETESVQVAAWEALLALDDPAAAPVLRAYLAGEGASRGAQEQLVQALHARQGPGWWRQVIAAQPAM